MGSRFGLKCHLQQHLVFELHSNARGGTDFSVTVGPRHASLRLTRYPRLDLSVPLCQVSPDRDHGEALAMQVLASQIGKVHVRVSSKNDA